MTVAEPAPPRKAAVTTPAAVLTVGALAVAVNVVAGTAVASLAIPFLFLDTLGTFFVAAAYGVRAGVLVGVVTNLVLGVTEGPTAVPFALVNAAVAVVVGLLARRRGFTLPVALAAGPVVAVLAPALGTVIAVYVFGGLTGGALDLVVLGLRQAGAAVFTAAFLPRLGANAVDKVATALLVWGLLRTLPPSLVGTVLAESGAGRG